VVVKKTLRTMMLAAAGVLGSVAVAHAQQPPPPAPPPGQPGQPPAPPPAEFGVAPAALPSAPVANAPVPTVSFGNQPAPDSTTPAPEPEKKQNPLLLTRFNWTNTASAQIFGIGQSYQSPDAQQYTMDFSLNARYSFIADSTKRFYANVNFGWGAELTNSDTTARRNDWDIKDLSIGLGYQHKVYKNADGSLSTTPLISANVVLPTSKASRGSGKYLLTSVNAGLVQTFPLVPKSDWLSDIFMIGVVSWGHLFSRCTTNCNDIVALQRPRMDISGQEFFSPQLSSGMLAHDNVRLSFSQYTTIYKDLSFNTSFEITMPVKYAATAVDCVQIATGCTNPNGLDKPGATAFNPVTGFDIGFSYTLFNMTRIDLGYQNYSPALADNNQRRSIFYSPDAAFYTNVSIFLDSILDKAFNLTGGPTAKRAAKLNQRNSF
jgi:hypothetical protein